MKLNRYALTTLREGKGLSRKAFAEQVGISMGTLADLESGRRNGSPGMVRALAEALGVPTTALLVYPARTGDEGERD